MAHRFNFVASREASTHQDEFSDESSFLSLTLLFVFYQLTTRAPSSLIPIQQKNPYMNCIHASAIILKL